MYNVAEYIEECVQSLEMQSFKEFEVIFVDDCGTDDSIRIIERELGRIKTNSFDAKILKHDRNRGLSAARNTGFEAANGEYVYFLDSDDYITADCLEKLYHAAVESDADVTIGDYSVVGGKDTWLAHLNGEQCDDPLQGYLCGQYYVMAWNKLCKRSFLLKNNLSFIEGLVHEDEPWTFAMACSAKKIAVVNEDTYIYRVRENSLQTGKVFTKHFKAYLTILHEIGDIISENDLSERCGWWYEKRKALYFTQTIEKGSIEQQKVMYRMIRDILPAGGWNKIGMHYLMPEFLGIIAYRKFHKYLLC